MNEKEKRQLRDLLEEIPTWGKWHLNGIRVEHGDKFDEVDGMNKLSWLYENAPRFLNDLLSKSDD